MANGYVAVCQILAHLRIARRSINNVLGSKVTLLLGSTGYALYIGSYLYVPISSPLMNTSV